MQQDLPFHDRAAAGRALGAALRAAPPAGDVLVLGLPRGGVPVAAPVAEALGAPLDVLVVRKLGTPGHPELAMGALAAGVRVLNDELVARLGITSEAVEAVAAAEAAELRRREQAYRDGRPPLQLGGRTALLVDDGLATGATVLAAVRAVRAAGAALVVAAAPVGSGDACRRLRAAADDVRCLHTPPGFGSVGAYYRDFGQTSDDEVRHLLAGSGGPVPG